MLDPNEFLSDFDIRSVSRYYLDHPYSLRLGDVTYTITYEPAKSHTGMFGGNSSWRDYIVFNEYFHGDYGAGTGANHQTGWTDPVASLVRG